MVGRSSVGGLPEPDERLGEGLRALKGLAPYLWPRDSLELRVRVVLALVLLVAGMLVNITIPLFYKQIMASRKMQQIQPELQKIQKKYKGKNDPESRQAMTQETMELYKKEGTNPFSSCLPILAQSPFFFGLFQVLNGLDNIAVGDKGPVGPIDRVVASQAEQASIFERFRKGSNAGAQGVGLGLALVREFTELHHGEVTLVSRPGKGTEVTLRLPRRQPE